MSNTYPVIVITMGDPAGIGPEITLKSFVLEDLWQHCVPLVSGDIVVAEAVRDRLDIPVKIVEVQNAEQARELAATEQGLPVVPVLNQGVVTDLAGFGVGQISALGGQAAVAYIRAGVDLCNAGVAQGIATGPIHKEALRAARFSYIGHTEMISEMSNGKKGITMFEVEKLKIFFHSRHVSVRQAIDLITTNELYDTIDVTVRCLDSVGISKPSIAVAALNPHASDGGLFGDEEAVQMTPAIERAVAQGHNVVGPMPADSVFYHGIEGRYDAVISLFHDQGHIAAKCYSFHQVVSVTFGYPFIRTSVDHGTAFDVAWQGKANALSMKEQIVACGRYAAVYRPVYETQPL